MALRFPATIERAGARSVLSLPPPLLRRIVGPPECSPEGYRLDLQVQALLRLIGAMRVPPPFPPGGHPGSGGAAGLGGHLDLSAGAGRVDLLARARADFDRSAVLLDRPAPGDVASYDRTIPGATGPRRARVYVPRAAHAARGAAPGLVYLHGGGWVVGSIESHDRVCRALASRAGVLVVSVDYRLAPEHPFPAAADDALAVTLWVLDHAASLGMDPTRVAVGGDSAGGELAAVVAMDLRDEARKPAFQLLIYPATDMTRSLPSHAHFGGSYFLSTGAGDFYLGAYAPDSSCRTDPRASPLFARDLSRLPPALVVVAGFDPLRDEGRAYADKMRAAGVEVECICSEGSMHGFIHLAGVVRESARVADLIADRLRDALAANAAPRAASTPGSTLGVAAA